MFDTRPKSLTVSCKAIEYFLSRPKPLLIIMGQDCHLLVRGAVFRKTKKRRRHTYPLKWINWEYNAWDPLEYHSFCNVYMIYLIILFVIRVMFIMFKVFFCSDQMYPCISVDCINITVNYIIMKKIFLPMNKKKDYVFLKKT